MQLSLSDVFQEYLQKKSLFRKKNILTTRYKPDDLPHRESEIKNIAAVLKPALRKEKPSNIFIYGKTGTGKTAVAHYVSNKLQENGNNIKTIYINCKMKKIADTEYRLIAKLTKELGTDVPSTGLPTDQVYEKFFDSLENQNKVVILILDEMDALVEKTGDGFLYNLTRLNEDLENSQLTLIGISNKLSFTEDLDPRVRSSLSEEEILFPPYNARQLNDILKKRSERAFVPGTIEQGVIEKCSALAAQEHGDARRALDLLRVAGETSERENSPTLKEYHVDIAEAKIDMDRILEVTKTQPRQSQTVLWSIIELNEKNGRKIQTGDVYSLYQKVCSKTGLNPLTQRRVSDMISELDLLGIINTKVISQGRYGRSRVIEFRQPREIKDKIKNSLNETF